MANVQHYFKVLTLVVTVSVTKVSATCYQAPSSEGRITLNEGEFACAALQSGQTLEDLGKYYIVCSHGQIFTQPCPPGLRWDTTVSSCNFGGVCSMTDRAISVDGSPRTSTVATTDQTTTSFIPSSAKSSLSTTTTSAPPTAPTTSTTATATTSLLTEEASTTTVTPTTRRPTTLTSSTDYTQTSSSPTPTSVPSGSKTGSDKPSSATTQTTQASSSDCVNAATSEGPRTLQNQYKACAPLLDGETETDKGKRFITCVDGTVPEPQACPSSLRFDTAAQVCNWPSEATCDIASSGGDGGTTNAPTGPTTTTTTTTTTPRAPHTTQKPLPLPSGACNATSCQMPDCFCYGDTPKGISLQDMPQFIMLTFDDAVPTFVYNSYYRDLLEINAFDLFNPTNCKTRSALYVSHQDTDYDKVRALYDAGNEIGSHTIHHSLPWGDKPSDYPEMVDEIQGLKDEVFKALGDKELVDSMLGFRAPYLRVAHDVMFDVLRDYGFLYDTSILNIEILQGRQPLWPFTLDFEVGRCANPPCPSKAYPGLWEVPLNGWIGDDGSGCSMIDDCSVGSSRWTASQSQWYNLFDRNFKDYFYPIKVPLPVFTHPWLFTNYPKSFTALGNWLHDILADHNDVWLVTPRQVIQWMQNPLTNTEMIAQGWGC